MSASRDVRNVAVSRGLSTCRRCLYLFRLWQQIGAKQGPVRWSPFHLAKNLTVVVLVMLAVVFVAFGFETGKLLPPESIAEFQGAGFKNVGGDTAFGQAAVSLTIPAPSFFRGLYALTLHNFQGHPSYLLGQHSLTGWWYHFPVVAGVKTPTGTLLLLPLPLALALTAAATVLFREGLREAYVRLKRLSPQWYILLFPPALYFAVCIRSHISAPILKDGVTTETRGAKARSTANPHYIRGRKWNLLLH